MLFLILACFNNFDVIEITAITDPQARVNSLIAGDMHMITDVDAKMIKLIEQSNGVYVNTTKSGRYGKPGISSYLPVDASGNLLDPLAAGLIKDYDVRGRRSNWKFGDQSPAETAWRRSSAYPFSVIKTFSLSILDTPQG